MVCPFCQNEIRDGLRFCTHCGADLSGVQAQAAPPQAETVSAPMPQPQTGQPPQGASKRALFLNFNEKPVNIIQVMDEAKRQQGEFAQSYRKMLRIIALFLPAGLPFVVLDWLLGNRFLTFSLVAYVLWGAALVGVIVLGRNLPATGKKRPGFPLFTLIFWIVFLGVFVVVFAAACGIIAFFARNLALLAGLVLAAAALVGLVRLWQKRPMGEEFGAKFDAVHTIFETLKDDVAPKRTLLGWLDLTGTEQESKIVQKRTAASGMPVAFYRDEWLRMKMPLYDGNVMRVSAVGRVKAKLGHWKHGSSGKLKWKPGGTVWDRNELRVAVVVNPEAFQLLPLQSGHVGKFAVDASEADDARLVLKAGTNATVDGWDILHVLRFAYDHVKPRGTPAA
jgi:hypothetical protein